MGLGERRMRGSEAAGFGHVELEEGSSALGKRQWLYNIQNMVVITCGEVRCCLSLSCNAIHVVPYSIRVAS